MTGLVPAVLMATAVATAGAQTRTAPSIGDAVRRTPDRVITSQGVSVRGVPLPGQNCRAANGYGYDGRYDRTRDDRDDRRLSDRERAERAKEQRAREEWERRNRAAGCCVEDGYNYPNGTNGRGTVGRGTIGTGTGTVDTRRTNGNGTYGKTGVTGNGRINPHANAQNHKNGCGYDDRRDDHRNDRDDHRKDHGDHHDAKGHDRRD
jgi:hypothetical protein